MKFEYYFIKMSYRDILKLLPYLYFLIVAWEREWIFWGRYDAEFLGRSSGTIP